MGLSTFIGLVFLLGEMVLASSSVQSPMQPQVLSEETPLLIEIGEEWPLQGSIKKIWIENKKLLIAQLTAKGNLFLKPLTTGQSYIRLDGRLQMVKVLPLGSKRKFQIWKKISQQFVQISVDYCQLQVCLKGSLFRIEDYRRLLSLMQQHQSYVLLALHVDPFIIPDLEQEFKLYMRQRGITPNRVIFNSVSDPVWSTSLTATNLKASESSAVQLRHLGIRAQQNHLTPEIRDNIKVAVRIMEINKNFERRIGVQWPESYHAEVLSLSQLEPEKSFELALLAAQRNGEARMLASPTLISRSGELAEFFAGGEFPIRIHSHKNSQRNTSLQWKKYGISLKLFPKIDPLGQMSLKIASEVSSIDYSNKVDDIPALQSNRVSSFFDLIENKTIAISGLIKNEVSQSSAGLPWLKDIPILGSLFSSRSFQNLQSELVIFVTPSLME
ncbi:flp pilus assembly protein [Pseudobdellovibrio exovorus]|uniref:Flp pilus assembly protein n=1 Tax=Pseudobdellovibrio exovorus JSS TaxID=1184267 RepID=M4V645_9BACT|nr:flp pilus assembly protein [Pseudobdellovibrio exovorus]AGH94842.1 flp pilus assembly protein [Pseudobdellovibrio exovorus JSS]